MEEELAMLEGDGGEMKKEAGVLLLFCTSGCTKSTVLAGAPFYPWASVGLDE